MDNLLVHHHLAVRRRDVQHLEFIYVMEGKLVVNVDGTDFALDEGDAIYFDSSAPHSYRRESRAICTAIVVVAP